MVNEEVFVSVFSALGDTWVKPYQVLLYIIPQTLYSMLMSFKCSNVSLIMRSHLK